LAARSIPLLEYVGPVPDTVDHACTLASKFRAGNTTVAMIGLRMTRFLSVGLTEPAHQQLRQIHFRVPA
jgi:hypothetical protein